MPVLAEVPGGYLSKSLAALEGVGDVRGLGLLLAAELVGRPAMRCRPVPETGLIVNPVTATALRLEPPFSSTSKRSMRAWASSPGSWRNSRDPSSSRHGRPGTRGARDGAGLCRRRVPSPGPSGRGVALVFQKPSARTRSSSELAVVQLGGHPVTIRGDEVAIDRRESAEDVARTLSQYHCASGPVCSTTASSSGSAQSPASP